MIVSKCSDKTKNVVSLDIALATEGVYKYVENSVPDSVRLVVIKHGGMCAGLIYNSLDDSLRIVYDANSGRSLSAGHTFIKTNETVCFEIKPAS